MNIINSIIQGFENFLYRHVGGKILPDESLVRQIISKINLSEENATVIKAELTRSNISASLLLKGETSPISFRVGYVLSSLHQPSVRVTSLTCDRPWLEAVGQLALNQSVPIPEKIWHLLDGIVAE